MNESRNDDIDYQNNISLDTTVRHEGRVPCPDSVVEFKGLLAKLEKP